MLSTGLKCLCEKSEKYKRIFNEYIEKDLKESQIEYVYNTLSNLLFDVDSSVDVALCFPQLLLKLLHDSVSLNTNDKVQRNKKMELKHRNNCVILGNLVQKHPDVSTFCLKYFELYPSPFDTKSFTDFETPPKKLKFSKGVDKSVSDLNIVIACYSFLCNAADFYREKWDWSEFISLYSQHENQLIRWICYNCIGIITGMSEHQLKLFLNSTVPVTVQEECILEFSKYLKSEYIFELTNCEKYSENISSYDSSFKSVSDNIISVSNILLPIFNKKFVTKSNIVEVESTQKNLRKIALAVASNKAVCLQGPVGSGKTALVEHLVALTGRKIGESFIKVQLGDETDSKMLLGSYKCTDVPGEFVWQPGVLTQAVMSGYWILLEDIDSASMDVATVLTSLLENKHLSVPGYRDVVKIAPGFQLFVTRRLFQSVKGFMKNTTNSSIFIEKKLFQVDIEPLTQNELIKIIQTSFPQLKTIADKIVPMYLTFSSGMHELSEERSTEIVVSKTGRLISTRDLIKFCTRATVNFDVSSKECRLKVFQDAIDLFCWAVPSIDLRKKLAREIASKLGIVDNIADHFCLIHKPVPDIRRSPVQIGRVSLKKMPATGQRQNEKFSFTRPTCVLIEKVACCIKAKEPVLLVGETGVGKTASVQFLADVLGQKLIVINMNQQSESTDLLGSYKPVDLKFVMAPIRNQFEHLLRNTFDVEKVLTFLQRISAYFNNGEFAKLVRLMKFPLITALKKLSAENLAEVNEAEQKQLLMGWKNIGLKLDKLETQLKQKNALVFSFIEGSLVKALENGYWVLLDEINLASAETLECLSGLLEGSSGSLSLLDRGDDKPIKRHENFTLFACMNPATDVGKKDLPAGLRNRFTEFYVEELTKESDLNILVNAYLEDLCLPENKRKAIVKFYLTVRKEATNSLKDGVGHSPHFSLRTLCRALRIAAKKPCGSAQRSLYEAFCLSFLTQLNQESHGIVEKMITATILSASERAVLKQPIPMPEKKSKERFENIEDYWITVGSMEPVKPENYILTKSVKKNLRDLARVVSIGKLPVLLQGDTSVGKTSLINYLAKASGNKCVRINNHEHTDLQEYIGSYVADESGNLVFREGVLVEAMRNGHWIILDELNLAPSEVLEALNRVLDDNRELFIPETQKTVKAHKNFMLFATQNPPGQYGGRKMLSRAFRNRFVELHFDKIPTGELEMILNERCGTPASYCKDMVAVMVELQSSHSKMAVMDVHRGFITLRDLFRWGERYRLATDVLTDDWRQHIADEGYLILAGRVRKQEERIQISNVIKKHIKKAPVEDRLFTLNEKTSPTTKSILEKILSANTNFAHIVWTFNMRKLAVLAAKALEFNEPVLLVGATGGGKTTVCQLLAEYKNQRLYTVNCHMHTESSDFVGGLRPVRNRSTSDSEQKLFEWVDGPLIEAMVKGDLFLADEISLADDSVLERLNSLLEPERSLLLAEKSTESSDNNIIVADNNFKFVSTMNPGGDFGKKELSPALRNRFTEIWCDSELIREDVIKIIEHNIESQICFGNQEDCTSGIGRAIVDFIEFLQNNNLGKRLTVSIRDILTWVKFINENVKDGSLDVPEAYVHGACLTFLDSFGSGNTSNESISTIEAFKNSCLSFLNDQLKQKALPVIDVYHSNMEAETKDGFFGIRPFFIERGKSLSRDDCSFTFTAPTTAFNALRLLRGMKLKKAILLEGSPGVGKTSLVSALAKASGHGLLRINLSDQTDVSDLFGADLPVEGGTGGEFSWRDGPFLQALKNGDWILLDELNLASQSVLEGLNACLDHRGEIYVPELAMSFKVKEGTRLFACQNPLKQGGSRKGLPQSFLNRFTQVYISPLTADDLKFIALAQYTDLPEDVILNMITFNERLVDDMTDSRGGPWEFNLRDIQRWCEGLINYKEESIEIDAFPFGNSSSNNDASVKAIKPRNEFCNPGKLVRLIYSDRMRTLTDKQRVIDLYNEIFKDKFVVSSQRPFVYVTSETLYIGDVKFERRVGCTSNDVSVDGDVEMKESSDLCSAVTDSSDFVNRLNSGCVNTSVLKQDYSGNLVLRTQLHSLKSLLLCIKFNWMSILVGPAGSGKNSIVRTLSVLTGHELKILSVNSAMDTIEILGGFEQTDFNRHLEEIVAKTDRLILAAVQNVLTNSSPISEKTPKTVALFERIESYRKLINAQEKGTQQTMAEETKLFREKLAHLKATLFDLNGSFPSYELDVLLRRLEKLEKCVEKEGNLNSGGKFEWVDSMLIKCLQDGSWLLIDNVNLCSPAVLDRLNALLEPNGVLTLGERGVDQNGEMITIKPHPNFRLFLAMDPKNGEISRAMRNRGVEIYILNEEDGEEQNDFDLHSILNNIGLKSACLQSALIEIHHYFHGLVLGEKPNISHLVHAGYVIAQQILRGINISTAFCTTINDVYVKNHIFSETSSMEIDNINEKIDDILRNQTNAVENVLNYETLTLNSLKLQTNSDFELIKQQSAYLEAYLKLTNIEQNEKLILYLIINFYYVASAASLNIRHSCLNQLLGNVNNETISQKYIKINDALKETIKSSLNGKCALPWDTRWLPEMDMTFATLRNESECNKLALSLYFNAVNRAQFGNSTSTSIKFKSMSVLDYSTAIQQNRITKKTTDKLLITDFVLLIEKFDRYLQSVFVDSNSVLNSDTYGEMISLLNWRHRLNEQGKLKLSIENVTSVLIVHYRWLLKYTISKLLKITTDSDERKCLMEIVDLINADIEVITSPFIKINKRFIKADGETLPYTNSQQVDIFRKFYQLANDAEIRNDTADEDFSKKAQFLLSETGQKWKFEMLDIRKQLNSDNYEIIASNLNALTKTLTEFNCAFDENKLYKLQMMPVLECLASYSLLPIKNIAFSKSNLSANEKENLSKNVEILKTIETAPLNLISLLENRLNNKSSSEIRKALFKFFKNNSSVFPNKYINCFNAQENEEIELTLLDPVMMHLITNLTVNKKQQVNFLTTTSLGGYKSKTVQLQALNEILWRNTVSLTSDKYDFRTNEVQYALNSVSDFIETLNAALNNESTPVDAKNITEIAQKCLSTIESQYKTKNSLLNERKNVFCSIVINCVENYSKLIQVREFNLNNSVLLIAANTIVLLNYLKTFLNCHLSVIDPVHKRSLKLKYCAEEITDFETNLKSYDLQANVHNTNDSTWRHPFYESLALKLNELRLKQRNLETFIAERPASSVFSNLVKDLSYFINSQLSTEVFEKLFGNVNQAVEMLNDRKQNCDLNKINSVCKELENWLYSKRSFSYTISKNYANWYPDLVEPVLSSLSELSYGLSLLKSLLNKLLIGYKYNMNDSFEDFIINTVKFPNVGPKRCNKDASMKIISNVLSNDSNKYVVKQEMFRLLKYSLQDLQNVFITDGKICSKQCWNEFDSLIKLIVNTWKTQEEERLKKIEEEESLYQTKSKCENLSEEEQAEQEMKMLFPTYHDADFSDIISEKVETLENYNKTSSAPTIQNVDTELSGIITEDDIKFIYKLHSKIVKYFTRSEWLHPRKSTLKTNYVSPFIQKIKTFTVLIDKIIKGLDSNIEKQLYGSYNLLTSMAKCIGSGDSTYEETKSVSYNFYHDKYVEKVRECYPVLIGLKERIRTLLDEFSTHPTLVSIESIVSRILCFEVISPVSRFLTGLELLLSKCNEWEQVAHSGISLTVYSQEITKLVISWHKLELNGWKDLLSTVVDKVHEGGAKWWFHIYSIMDEYIADDSEMTSNQLLATLKQFVEGSTLGEFYVRLDILYVFHCHATNLPPSARTNEFKNILWNLNKFYSQFSPTVDSKIKELRSPIEKELKDYVKIVRWNDINYWSTKETVEKSHRRLHKSMKLFESVLKQPANVCFKNLTDTDKEEQASGIGKRPQRHPASLYHYKSEPRLYIARSPSAKIANISSAGKNMNVMKLVEGKFVKSKELCEQIITTVTYPVLIKNLDFYVSNVIATVNHLRDLEVPKDVSKAKQKSAAKSIGLQKRRALSELFKTLEKLGLSHNTGLVEKRNREKDISNDFVFSPMDFEASLGYLKPLKGDGLLLKSWDGCESYYLKSVSRLAALNNALINPSSELDPRSIDRFSGFSTHLMILADEQKRCLVESSRNLYYLRGYIGYLIDVINSPYRTLEIIGEYEQISENMRNLFNEIISFSEQFQVFLKSCPDEKLSFDDEDRNVFVIDPNLDKSAVMNKSDTRYIEVVSKIKNLLSIVAKLKNDFEEQENVIPLTEDNGLPLKHVIKLQDLKSICDKLEVVNNIYTEIKLYFESTHPIYSSLDYVENLIKKQLKRVDAFTGKISLIKNNKNDSNDTDSTDFLNKLKPTIENTLLVIQNIYKKYITEIQKQMTDTKTKKDSSDLNKSTDDANKTINEDDEENIEALEDDHLKIKLIENMNRDLKCFNMKELLKKLNSLIFEFKTVDNYDTDNYRVYMNEYIPLLDQTLHLYQYFVTQQLNVYRITCKMASIIFNIFLELSAKGFCIPPELSDEQGGKQGNQFGMGLDEGTGEKDVSERIESEDQLADAKRPEDYEKEEKEDCKEEQGGIEMSDDFDANLQDVEKNADDESENEDEGNSDADEQMGETDPNSDKLDERIWGDDKDDGSEDEGESNEADGNKGEDETGRNNDGGEDTNKGKKDGELGAKDGESEQQSNEQDEVDENATDNRDREIEKEINEMEEPEYDDDHVDPYHGKQPPLPEPEAFDLPDDMQIDDDVDKQDDVENTEDNPFNIDSMKDQMPPKEDETPIEDDKNKEDKSKDETKSDSDTDDFNLRLEEEESQDEKKEDDNDHPDNKEQSGGLDEENEDKKPVNEGDEAVPSNDEPTKDDKAEAMDVEAPSASSDNVQNAQELQKNAKPNDEATQLDNADEKEGVGQAQMEQSDEGHRGETQAMKDVLNSKRDRPEEGLKEKQQKLGQSDSKRSLGQSIESVKKKLKTMDIKENETEQEEDEGVKQGESSDTYQHIENATESDTQVLDAATKEQAETQQLSNLEKETNKEEEPEEDVDVEMLEDDLEPTDADKTETLTSEKTESKKERKGKTDPKGDIVDELLENKMDVEGDAVDTSTVQRKVETTYHTQFENIHNEDPIVELKLEEVWEIRRTLNAQFQARQERLTNAEAEQAWQGLYSLVAGLARDLCEQLRLVLEPTQTSRLKGDYRTGRRINMRKVIPYIASEFRKDKIWMRRTKPSKREYQIVIAIDDSLSMDDSHSKELAFESVALVSTALTLLESGQLGVLKFGQSSEVVHSLENQFTEKSGMKILQDFTFKQTETRIAEMIKYTCEMFEINPRNTPNVDNARLLFIFSDGRITTEGTAPIHQAIRRAKAQNIFIVFVIIDNPQNKNSILDTKKATFGEDGKAVITSYLSTFPFEYYLILQDIKQLSTVLSDALRQWFEFVTRNDL